VRYLGAWEVERERERQRERPHTVPPPDVVQAPVARAVDCVTVKV